MSDNFDKGQETPEECLKCGAEPLIQNVQLPKRRGQRKLDHIEGGVECLQHQLAQKDIVLYEARVKIRQAAGFMDDALQRKWLESETVKAAMEVTR